MALNKLITGGGVASRKGFLSRMFSWAQNNLGFLPYVNSICSIGLEIVGGINDTFGTNWKIVDETLTDSETIILDNWDLNKFTPFVKSLFEACANIDSQTSQNIKIQFVNDLLIKMQACITYYENNEFTNLSANAIQVRNSYINSTFQAFFAYFQPENLPFLPLNIVSVNEIFEASQLPFLGTSKTVTFDIDLFSIPNVLNPDDLTPSTITYQNNPAPVVLTTIPGASSSTNAIISNPTNSNGGVVISNELDPALDLTPYVGLNPNVELNPRSNNLEETVSVEETIENTANNDGLPKPNSSTSTLKVVAFSIASFFALRYAFKKNH